MTEQNQDTQHPATPVRLQQACQDGDAAKSQELIAAVQLLTGITAIYFLIQGLISGMVEFTSSTWGAAENTVSLTTVSLTARNIRGLFALGQILLPLLVVICCAAILSHLIQSGSASAFRRPLIEFRNLNPGSGIMRLFSFRSISRGIFGIPKIVVVVLTTMAVGWYYRLEIGRLQYIPAESITEKMVDCLFAILFAAAFSLLVLAVLDYLLERFSFGQRHRMTDQQLRDENRMQGADPQITDRRRQFYQNR